MKSFTFDLVLTASLTLKAEIAADALATLQQYSQTMDCNGGAWPDGSPILFEASMNERPTLAMIDGEDAKEDVTSALLAACWPPAHIMFLVSGDSGDLDVSAFVEANDRQHALDMHADYIKTEFQVYGNELDCPRNVWEVPATRGTVGVLGWKADVTLCEGVDGFYREGDDSDENPFPKANHKISILFGKDLEDGQEAKTYEFASAAELAAFTRGVEEAEGWLSYEIVKEGHVHYFDEDKSNAVEAGYIQYADGQDVTPPGGEGEWWYRKDAPDGDWFQSAAECLEAEENRQ